MEKRKLAKDLLLSSNYWVLNKEIVGLFGIETAFLLSAFAEAENILADADGWFYQTIEKTEEITTLSRYKQEKSISILLKEGVLEQRNQGIPMKRYFKINYDVLATKYVKNSQTRVLKISNNKESIIYKENKNHSAITHKPTLHKSITYTEQFEHFYSIYPNPFNKQQTYKNYLNVIKSGISHEEIMLATEQYIKELKQTDKINSPYITRSSNFVGQKADYLGYLEKAVEAKKEFKRVEIVFE